MNTIGRTAAMAGVMVLALAMGACARVGGGKSLEGTSWTLTSMNGQPLVAGSTITAGFGADGRVAGSSGCNGYSASYETSGASLTISQANGTLMACEESLMKQESDYLAALAATASFMISGDTMALKDSSGATRLVFTAQANDLAGTSWVVTGYNNGQGAVVSVMIGTEMTAAFGADGALTGSAGCNSYNATYSTSGDSISIGPVAATRMFCGEPQGVMDQEAQYLAALGTASTSSMSGTKLELRTADGALAASFQTSQP